MLIQFSQNGDWFDPRDVKAIMVRGGRENLGHGKVDVLEVVVVGIGSAGDVSWVLEADRMVDALSMRDSVARMVNDALGPTTLI
jgi:hypothetical protein